MDGCSAEIPEYLEVSNTNKFACQKTVSEASLSQVFRGGRVGRSANLRVDCSEAIFDDGHRSLRGRKIESSAMPTKPSLIQSRTGSVSMASYLFPWYPCVIV